MFNSGFELMINVTPLPLGDGDAAIGASTSVERGTTRAASRASATAAVAADSTNT